MNQLKHLKTFSFRVALTLLVMMLTMTAQTAWAELTCVATPPEGGTVTVDPTYPTRVHVTVNTSDGYVLDRVVWEAPGVPAQTLYEESGGGTSYYQAPNANGTVTAYFNLKTQNVQVRFNMNGHGANPGTQDLTLGLTATRPTPDPTANGYVFLGWFTNSSCTNLYVFSTALDASLPYDATNNCFYLTLYAGWVAEADLSGTCGKVDANTTPPLDGSEVTWAVTKSTGSDEYDLLTISGSGAMADYKNMSSTRAPWYNFRAKIKTIVIDEGVTAIGNHAFYQFANVTSDITIPASVTNIGKEAFMHVSESTAAGIHITAAEGSLLTSIGEHAFNSANASIDLSPCTSLTAISNTFVFHKVTKDVTLPSSLTSICQWAFSRYDDGAFLGDHAYVIVPDGKALSVTIDGVTEPVVIEPTDGKADILGCLYADPANRTESRALTLYAGVGTYFGTCGTNATWAVTKSTGSDDYDMLTISGSGAMTDYKKIGDVPWYNLRYHIKTIVIDEGVTAIGDLAFYYLVNVTSDITIPASVASIGKFSFGLVSKNTATGIHITAAGGSVLASLGSDVFGHANASIDLSPCTLLTAISNIYVFLAVTKDVTLPSSLNSICKWGLNRFRDDSFLGDHLYVVVPDGKALSVTIDGVTEPVVIEPTDGKADILGCLYADPANRGGSRAVTLAMVPTATLALAANLAEGNYWTTFYCGDASYLIDEGENATAYTAEVSGNNVVLHSLNKDIPKQTAVIIKGEDGSISMTKVADPDLIVPTNALHGVDYATATSTLGEGTFYVLGKVGENFGFHHYTGSTMPAQKAYLLLSSSAAPSLSMTFGEETTGISPIENGELRIENSTDAWYTLDGRRLSEKPTAKGVYIVNGRKVFVK